MNLRWVKMPTAIDPALQALSLRLQGTFWELFRMASRDPDCLGCLPYSLRTMATRLRLPLSTLHRYMQRLREADLITDMPYGIPLLPSVVQIEQRFGTHPDASPTTTLPRRRRFPDDDASPDTPARVVENLVHQVVEHPSKMEHPCSTGGTQELLDRTCLSHSAKDETCRPLQKPVQKRPEDLLGRSPDKLVDLVPKAIQHPDARYLLAKLASSSETFARLLVEDRERHAISRLYAEHAQALVRVLRQAADDPAKIRHAGRWLNGTVPKAGAS